MASVAGLPDLDARVIYFPVRHHSPACAWHVGRLIRQIKPDAVLIEGPRNATPLIPIILHPGTRLPVAIYTTYVQRQEDDLPLRHAGYYPLCEYSPEYAAMAAAHEVGAKTKFIDLTFPEMVVAANRTPDEKVVSLLEERYLRHSRTLQEVCRRAGSRDPDDLWDQLYEVGCRRIPTDKFMRNVLAYCALARADHTTDMLESDGCLARERAMAEAIAREKGRVLVVTGGFHSVALPGTKRGKPKAVPVSDEDATVTLMRYGFEQLDRLNGYASGMPSPEFYQRAWEQRDPAELVVELGRQLRGQKGDASTADAIVTLDQSRRLAQLRGHAELSREDLLDGIRSAFIKGSEDIEGIVVLAQARKLLAGNRIGDLPPEAGEPPIVRDFRSSASRLGIDVTTIQGREVTLDLYRSQKHREVSRFFHRLRFLGVEFAANVRGPDFVKGESLERIQEVWRYHWEPRHEATLIERSLYGPTLEEAAASMVFEALRQAAAEGKGGRADLAARLLLEACRMGLHRHTQSLLERLSGLASQDASFTSLVEALDDVLVLTVSREPLEAHHLRGIPKLAEALYQRACYLLPGLAATPDEELDRVFDALSGLQQSVQTLGDNGDRQSLRWKGLHGLLGPADSHPGVRGAAAGLLFSDGQLTAQNLATSLAGHFDSNQRAGTAGAAFLRGLLRTARSVLWQSPDIISKVHEALQGWTDEHFIAQLPLLRLALADLTPRECDQVARAVAAHAGRATFSVHRERQFSEADLLRGVALNQRVAERLARDGLEGYLG
jgi:hypothetical protein